MAVLGFPGLASSGNKQEEINAETHLPLMILLASLIATFPAAGRPLAPPQQSPQDAEANPPPRTRRLAAPPQQSPQLDFSIVGGGLNIAKGPLSPGTKLSGSAAIKRVGKLGGTKLDILLLWGSSAKVIGSVSVPAEPAGTKQLKFVATIPKNLKPPSLSELKVGTYHVQLSIDPKNLIKESNEKNNNHLIAKKIQVAQP